MSYAILFSSRYSNSLDKIILKFLGQWFLEQISLFLDILKVHDLTFLSLAKNSNQKESLIFSTTEDFITSSTSF